MNDDVFTFGDPLPKAPESARPKILLTVDLVPMSSWQDNVRTRESKATWDRLRKATYRRAGYVCEVCGENGKDQGREWPVECHEIWEYNEQTRVQKLVGLIALCPACHEVKHTGRTVKLGGQAARACVMARLVRVNGWTPQAAELHVREAFQVWERRSRQDWTLDLTFIEPFHGSSLPPSE